ncbi:MAG: preprotein translocase subunit YajC [Nitrospinae bacterium]|nr:preprotein translocase subunit YajC [Nitrospinota bacterium]
MAPAPDGAPQEGHALVMIVFYAALFGVFYFLLIRPQSKRNREVRELQDSLSKGDRVVTTGGIFATVHKVEEDVVTLEIAEGVRVKAQRGAVSERIGASDAGKKKEDA